MKYIEQSKFSQTIVSFRYILPFEKETSTGYNLLCYMLKSKTEDFDNKQIISYEFNKNTKEYNSLNLPPLKSTFIAFLKDKEPSQLNCESPQSIRHPYFTGQSKFSSIRFNILLSVIVNAPASFSASLPCPFPCNSLPGNQVKPRSKKFPRIPPPDLTKQDRTVHLHPWQPAYLPGHRLP